MNESSAGTEAPPSGARSRLPRRVLAVAVPLVLVLGAAGGALASVRSTLDAADRTTGTALWTKQHAPGKDPYAPDFGKGRTDTELARQLLPVSGPFVLGPDTDEDGNDSVAEGEKAARPMKDLGKSLSGAERRAWDKLVKRSAPSAVAHRTYAERSGLLLGIGLSRAQGGKDVADSYAAMSGAFAGVAKPGPKVPGHPKDARCFNGPEDKTPAGKATGLADLLCLGHRGDVFAVMTASGTAPLDGSRIAGLFARQMDRLKSTGAAA